MVRLKRFLVITVLLSVSFVLQFVILPRIPNLIAVPNLLLVAVLSTGFLYGKGIGLTVGVAAGLLLDLLGTGTPGFYTLILALLGYGDGILSEKIDSELVFVLLILLVINEVLFHAYVFLLGFLIDKSFQLLPYLSEVFLPELFLTMIFFMVMYGLLLFISKRWDLKVNKGAVRVV